MTTNTGGAAALDTLLAAVCERRTGALEWTDERRRRLVFFERGELVLTQSNLRSEAADRVDPRATDPDGALAALRIAALVAEPRGAAVWHPESPAPGRQPADVVALLWELGPALPQPPATARPVVSDDSGRLGRLPIGAELCAYLSDLDGTITLEDVVAFAPADPDVVSRAVAVGMAVGAVRLDGTRGARVVSRQADGGATSSAPTRSEPRAPAAAAADLDDIASFISDELTTAPARPAPRDAAAPRRDARPLDDDDGEAATALDHVIAPTFARGAREPATRVTADPVAARFGPLAARIRGAKDHFDALGTSWQDDVETHRRAYFTLARTFHPDQTGDAPPSVQSAAAELFDRVRAAWEVLADDAKREAYIARVVRGEKTEDEKAMDRVRLILDAEADFKRGVVELQAGRLAQAHELLARATAAVPEEAEFEAYHVYTSFKLARDAAAADGAFQRMRELVKGLEKSDGAWVLLGMAARARGQDNVARAAFVQALKIKPANPDAVRELKRMERDGGAPPPATKATPAPTSFFGRLFGGKK